MGDRDATGVHLEAEDVPLVRNGAIAERLTCVSPSAHPGDRRHDSSLQDAIDVLRGDAHLDEPAVVFVDEEPKFVGRPCAGRNGHLKVCVAGAIPPELEEHYKNRCRPIPL